jgi:hypothetical protein
MPPAPATGALTGGNTLTIGTGVTYSGGEVEILISVGATTEGCYIGWLVTIQQWFPLQHWAQAVRLLVATVPIH